MRRVDYRDQEVLIRTRSGWKLRDSLHEMGVGVTCDCNPRAGTSTGQCAVKYPKGELFLLTAPAPLERQVLGEEKLALGWRLSCQAMWK